METIHQTGLKPFNSGVDMRLAPSTWNMGCWDANTHLKSWFLAPFVIKGYDLSLCFADQTSVRYQRAVADVQGTELRKLGHVCHAGVGDGQA